MAGGHVKYRHLGIKSSHRQALLRNLATSLIEHESITTTWPKAKEAQRFAEKLITLGKRNTIAARNKATGILFRPTELLPKLFGPIRERYASRPGGYTRILRVEPKKEDGAATAILELVDGPRDMRFMMTAKTIARERAGELSTMSELTAKNMKKVTQFRPEGQTELARMVEQLERRTNEIRLSDDSVQKAWEARRKDGDRKVKVYNTEAGQGKRRS